MAPSSAGRRRRPPRSTIRRSQGSRDTAGKNVPAGTTAVVRSLDALRALEGATALSTLIRQRHLTPTCGGHAPTAERTVGPARIVVESLTPRPGIREQHRSKCEELKTSICRPVYPSITDIAQRGWNGRKCHVWTAPSWQELSSHLQHWSVQPCVRPFGCGSRDRWP